MNIILTSAGLKMPAVQQDVLKLLPKPPKELKLGHIITASRAESNTAYVDWEREALEQCGFQTTDIALENLNPDTTFSTLNEFDILLVQGGNTFYLLKIARMCGFEQAVRKFLQGANRWYIGISAGSYIACPTIEMSEWVPKPDDHYGINDLTAMNLVPFLVTVHYDREKYRELLSQHVPTASAPVKILTDDQALLVRDDKITLIGEGPEISVSSIQSGRPTPSSTD